MGLFKVIGASACLIGFMTACGGGGGGGSSTAPTSEHTVSVTQTAGGSVSPSSASVASGQSAQFTLAADAGYSIGSATGCGGSLSGNTYQTGPINAACTVTVNFTSDSLDAPEGFSLAPDNEQLSLSWDAVSGASGYNLYYANEADVTPENYASLSGGTRIESIESPHVLTGLLNTSTYYLVVTAYNAGGESSPSLELSANPGSTELTFEVDAGIEPAQSTVEDSEGMSRSLARMVDGGGVATDFLLNELVIYTDNEAKVNAIMGRWSGSLLKKVDMEDGFSTYRIAIDPSTADAAAMIATLNELYPEVSGLLQTSSEAAAQLLAIAYTEMHQEQISVFPNFVAFPQDISGGTTAEASISGDGDYSPNAFDWTYMNQGSAQDIGVGAAWQAMERGGRFDNKVPIMIMDGGFAPNADFPGVRQVIGRGWNIPNPSECGGGTACPWHGTNVTTSAMGTLDNGFGVAGPAGPVGQLVAVQFSTNVVDIIETLVETIGTLPQVRIINLSFSLELGSGWDVASRVFCFFCPHPSEILSGITQAVTNSNTLIFASAGNNGSNVDTRNGLGIERSTTLPCELNTVICVGGMAYNATVRDGNSNFGSRTDNNSVDIYGPYTVWGGSAPDIPGDEARKISGTSYSSPFVAGVAALVWAADPSLTSQQVWSIVRDTAHVGGVGVTGHQRRINAFDAVAEILGGGPPTVTLNSSTTIPLNREWAVTAVANDPEYGGNCPPVACPLAWSPEPDRIVGNTAFYRFTTAGNASVTVTAEDLIGQATSASRSVNVINSPPIVTLSQPTAGATIYVGQEVQLLGTATDANEGADPGPGNLSCTWTSSNAGDADFPHTGSCNRQATFASTGTRTLTLRATDPQGLSSSDTVTITVSPAPANLPPTISMGSISPGINYNGDGYTWSTTLTANASATDPEGNNPITYIWRATSFEPNSATEWRSNVQLSSSASSGNLSWTPSSSNPSDLIGSYAQLGNDCYSGQVVRLTLEARDSLGNSSFQSLPDIKVYRCILI
ncbi:S8 family serine peptidase [Gilvimarinus agarilyticus]|uniref:S8 family peptidase n=1 Tax=Gilvimarinus sp. 2_MG-2023 TaxID=3062666 RepID=UPI001C090CC6|nr:S8 family serine peptidase [Gilvimarinus sp. 2_MG-2023]MBU2887768.1 S8 family serine peptidase [Gilvimarinus agarilyticus]MDO6572407.1 S8 family serine peptidase [Gilvimarinus sp. 2_MG-2023]